MNNRGQTLVLFLFLFPVLFLLFMAVYQIGTIELEKRKKVKERKNHYEKSISGMWKRNCNFNSCRNENS